MDGTYRPGYTPATPQPLAECPEVLAYREPHGAMVYTRASDGAALQVARHWHDDDGQQHLVFGPLLPPHDWTRHVVLRKPEQPR